MTEMVWLAEGSTTDSAVFLAKIWVSFPVGGSFAASKHVYSASDSSTEFSPWQEDSGFPHSAILELPFFSSILNSPCTFPTLALVSAILPAANEFLPTFWLASVGAQGCVLP